MKKMPVFFIGHGSPMNAIEENQFSKSWQSLADSFPKPRAVLCISAHWMTRQTSITTNDHPPTIHDFGGFPKELFEVSYPAPGDPELAKQIVSLLPEAEIKLDSGWGLDHGSWSILRHIFPKADIPILQLSLKATPDGQFHFDLGKKLKFLREDGILIIGSGNLIHNLGLVDWSQIHRPEFGYDWANRAHALFNQLILDKRPEALTNYESLGKDIELSIPTPEHYLPFLYILGASTNEDEIQIFNDKVIMGSLNMTSVRFG
jgi:4,5-DOPA dioxygenase extradiol